MVDLQLRWHHQFQFAGYYAALEKGFYREEGLEVRLHAGDPMHQPVQEVLSGRAQYAEGNSEVLYQRLKGKPLVALAAIFQHSPSILLTRKDSGIASVHDLVGKKVMLMNMTDDADFLTMFLSEGVSLSQVKITPSSYNLDDLVSGKVDAFNSYLTNEPYFLKQSNIAYNVIDPSNYRIDFYSDVLFTSEAELRDNPKRVEALRRATLKGWHYAMDHPNEIIDLLINKYHVEKPRDHLEFEAAEMRKLILPDLVEIGHMNLGRWQHMADTFVKAGLVKPNYSLDGFIYDPAPKRLPAWVVPVLIAIIIVLATVSSATYYLHRLNRSLANAKENLREGEEQLRMVLEGAELGFWDWDLVTGKVDRNERWAKMLGYTHDEIKHTTQQWTDFVHPDDRERVWRSINDALEGRSASHHLEYRMLHKDGSIRWILDQAKVMHRDADGKPTRMSGTHSDVTERKHAEAEVLNYANYDQLTMLPNRRLFQDRLEYEIRKAQRDKQTVALLFIDLDRFKDINDTLGHDIGDKLLIEAAARIRSCVRDYDTVARLGGDEFTVILPGLHNTSDIGRLAQAIIDSLSKPYMLDERESYVSASIGIALCPDDATNVNVLIKHADQAMYKAKDEGRNCFRYFIKAMQEEAVLRMQLAHDLRQAIPENQLDVYYQPIVELDTGQIHKAEALLRWKHPKFGFISPAEFIPIAEDTGTIHELGDWVFMQAISEVKRLTSKLGRDFQIGINKSPVQFIGDSPAHNHWIEKLAEMGLPGSSIVVEITEGLLMNDAPLIMEKLLMFSEAGIQVAIDDFGTGYSSLAYLKKYDIDYLKIDRSFTRNLAPDASEFALCEAIVMMAHKLGLKVVAEGVETEQQRDLLIQIGCDYGQGYLFSRAVPAEEFESLLGTG